MTRREWRLGRLLAVVVACTALAACGVPGQAHANKIAADEVPFGLIVTPTSTTTSVPAQARSTVYLLRAGRLVAVERQIPSDPSALVLSLAQGPDATEAAGGLRTAISDPDVIHGVTVTDPLGTVDLSSHFSELPRGDQLLAVAQLVYTLSGIPEVRNVAFTLDGRPTAVPRADGSLSDQPVDRDDYRELTSPAP
jgi:spore germination protein GerM